MIPLGTETPYGKVIAVGIINGERYYWFAEGLNLSMLPAVIVESHE